MLTLTAFWGPVLNQFSYLDCLNNPEVKYGISQHSETLSIVSENSIVTTIFCSKIDKTLCGDIS